MALVRLRIPLVAAAVVLLHSAVFAATFTVSKDGRGAFTSIQAAVNRAGPGDVVSVLDNAVYQEQVTIDSTKNGLTLTSSNPASLSKPKILFQDRINIGPRTCQEAKIDSMITFDRNGALRILGAGGVTIEGIAVDGGGAYVFGYQRIWSTDANCSQGTCNGSPCPLFHGNAGITVWLSGDVTIRNCDIANAYYGINFKDRNQGGIFGNPNPSDNSPWNVVPLSGFGRTGNHLVERNRIHNNSYGLFFESSWDLGSTVRYNLIYENHHQTDAFAAEVKALPDGTNEGGGAIKLKDDMLSPLAIYNNTFWHNFMIFFAHWQVGAQHLVFNNIYGAPFKYWGAYSAFSGLTYMELFPRFVYRMKNCVLAAQQQAPPTTPPFYSVQVMNGLQVQQTGGQTPAGSLINSPFPIDAEIRWLETPFKSTSPTDPNFLVPNWDDTLVQRYIRNKGWAAAGVKNPDGTVADLGAIPYGGYQTSVAIIRPTHPVEINGTTATMRFNLSEEVGTISNPKIVYFRFIKNVEFKPNTNYWSANSAPIIPATSIIDIPIPATPVRVGANSLTVTVPARLTGEDYAFFELIIEGTGADGRTVTSSVGFPPYRRLDYKFVVEVWNLTKTQKLTSVRAGEPVVLRISAYKADGSAFFNTVDPVEVRLLSGYDLLVPTSPPTPVTIPGGITISVDKQVMFTRIPDGGIEYVNAAGKWNNGTQDLPFFGTSDGIRVLPGSPEEVLFQDPPSDSISPSPTIIDPGIQYTGVVRVFDAWGNAVDQQVQVQVSSLQPTIGNVVGGARTVVTDSTGRATFKIETARNAQQDALFTLQAILPGKNTDYATMKVGKTRDKLWIFYSDTLRYDPVATTLEGQVGERKMITIIAGPAPVLDSMLDVSGAISVEGSTGLQFYATASDSLAVTTFQMVNGRVDVWVTSYAIVDNGSVSARSDSLGSVLPSDVRRNIFFSREPPFTIDSAFYYSDNGFGRVDRAEIHFRSALAGTPDSLALYWPSRIAGNRRTALPAEMTLSTDGMQLTVNLSSPFDTSRTFGEVGARLGTGYGHPNNMPELPVDSVQFTIRDRVGPLLMSASVVERTDPGDDTLYVTFSEEVEYTTLAGASLVLIRNGVSTTLSVDTAFITAAGFRLVITGQAVAPQQGDSLRINATGPLNDRYGNRAHAQNRPVIVTIRPIPAAITAAYYQDRNADGMVDTVIVRFAKNVSLGDLVFSLDWGGDLQATNISGARLFRPGVDSAVVGLQVEGGFLTDPGIRTSGLMFATVMYLSFPGESRGATVADSAGPVILHATFVPATLTEENPDPDDTLIIEFSESVASIGGFTPFKFYSATHATGYIMTVNTSAIPPSNTEWTFPVSDIQGVALPDSGDTVWIDPVASITDREGSVQTDPNNRRVPLNVEPAKKIAWKVSISDNPFGPDTRIALPGLEGRVGTAIEVTPLVRTGEDPGITAKATIYDAVGNIVVRDARFAVNSTNNRLYLVWDGTNRQNRKVGTGTYMAIVAVQDRAGGKKRVTLPIGVKR